jgi:hypothetical protein
VSLLAPSAQATSATGNAATRQADLILAAESLEQAASRGVARDAEGTADSPNAASAVAQNKARAQALAAPPPPPPSPPAPAQTFASDPDGYRAYAATKVAPAQFGCLKLLWERESNWRSTAQNPTSTAYGIAQLLDTTWSYTGYTKTSDGFRQVDAGLVYLSKAYPAGPCQAWAHETDYGWY